MATAFLTTPVPDPSCQCEVCERARDPRPPAELVEAWYRESLLTMAESVAQRCAGRHMSRSEGAIYQRYMALGTGEEKPTDMEWFDFISLSSDRWRKWVAETKAAKAAVNGADQASEPARAA